MNKYKLRKPDKPFVYDPYVEFTIKVRKSWVTKLDEQRKPYKLNRNQICLQIFKWALFQEEHNKDD